MTKKNANEEDDQDSTETSGEDSSGAGSHGGNGTEPPPSLNAKSEVAKLKEELEKEREKSRELKNEALRTAADFDNYRKRLVRDQQRMTEIAQETIIKKLLQVVDNFERAQQHSKTAPADAMRTGMEAIHQQFISFLKDIGVTVMEADGAPFDPHNHEAIGQQPSADVPEGTVLHVAEHGYLFKDRVLRHAKVIVSNRPEGADSGDPSAVGE